ncbi:MAG: hypothetical protein II904_05235 [Oscillospiraceae bacterium]|nr:hypothetical protein [Oscillospiraceae bacterium]
MSIKVKKAVSVALLLAAMIWNCVCLVGMLPYAKWPFSLPVGAAAVAVALLPAGKKEKAFSGATVSMPYAWGASVLACLMRLL